MGHLTPLLPCALKAWYFEKVITIIDLYVIRRYKSKVRPITGPEGPEEE
jgi:hypothetical protein